VDTWAIADAAVQGDCDQRGGRILDHMSTAGVARDLDRLRAAVGDQQLSYVGYSYGSYLGATYANLFPGRVRALVVDGVLDPVAWSTGDPGDHDWPFSTRLRSHVGAQDTLEEFFRLCDEAAADCPFASPEGAAARYQALRQTLATDPVVFDDGFAYTDRILVADTLGNLYGSAGWWYFADWLATLEGMAAAPGQAPAQAYQSQRRSVGSGRGGFPHYPGVEAFGGVACADSDNPDDLTHWAAAADDTRTGSLFGPLWTWVSSICSAWPGSQDDRYTGPWTESTANPVLVVNTRFDPATPLHGADRLAGLLPNSAQLTVEGWGHTAAFLSADADQAVSAYLLEGTLPAPGATYAQDFNPFTPPNAGGREGLRTQFEQILFDPTR
jgi:pimeloyl-ACP methyl ester carboxylesterase